MSDGYRFREVRKGERQAVLAFASQHGFSLEAKDLCHHLSLTAVNDGQIIAAALCVNRETGQLGVEIIAGDSDIDDALILELADRCLRKVQADDFAAARLHSPTKEPTDALWTHASWLDRVEETPPPVDPSEDDPAQAA